MATVTNYPIDLPILVIEAQIFVAVNKFQFLPNKLIPNKYYSYFCMHLANNIVAAIIMLMLRTVCDVIKYC